MLGGHVARSQLDRVLAVNIASFVIDRVFIVASYHMNEINQAFELVLLQHGEILAAQERAVSASQDGFLLDVKV